MRLHALLAAVRADPVFERLVGQLMQAGPKPPVLSAITPARAYAIAPIITVGKTTAREAHHRRLDFAHLLDRRTPLETTKVFRFLPGFRAGHS